MDPSTTLITFLLQTHPSVQSVHLIGSWDNFTQSYSMERDVRRGGGQWRGCHAFSNIICDDISSSQNSHGFNKRDGGLKMGHTYFYYYEVNGSTEMHDPAMPSTTVCPYLPGQTVNTLCVPVEQALRQRSASLSSMRDEDLKTMNPRAKFAPPRPVHTPSIERSTLCRLGSSPLLNDTETRSSSPAPVWKRLFSRKLSSRDGERGRSRDRDDQTTTPEPLPAEEERSTTPTDGFRARDISPESLRRFLSDDVPSRPDSNLSNRPSVAIPEDIAEEFEDDDNFATSAVSELQPFTTSLSPPPFKRGVSSDSIPVRVSNTSLLTLVPVRQGSQHMTSDKAPTSAILSTLPKLETASPLRDPLSPQCSSAFTSPISPRSPVDDSQAFYELTDDEDELASSNASDSQSYQPLPLLSL